MNPNMNPISHSLIMKTHETFVWNWSFPR